jgi:hypothetical protein
MELVYADDAAETPTGIRPLEFAKKP